MIGYVTIILLVVGLVALYLLKPTVLPINKVFSGVKQSDPEPVDTYIKPAEFQCNKVIPIDKDYKVANLCQPEGPLYVINQPGVYFGSDFPNECPANLFLRAP